MAITEAFAGSRSFANGDSWSLPRDASYSSASPQTDDGVYQIFIDVSAITTADTSVQIIVYEKVRTGDTQRAALRHWVIGSASGTPPNPIVVFPSLILLNGWDVRLIATIAANRTISWSIRKVA